MIKTSLPLTFDEPKKNQPKPVTVSNQIKHQQAVDEENLAKLTERKFESALQAYQNHPEWHDMIVEHMKRGLFGEFYKLELSLIDNLTNPALCGPFLQVIERLQPDVFANLQ